MNSYSKISSKKTFECFNTNPIIQEAKKVQTSHSQINQNLHTKKRQSIKLSSRKHLQPISLNLQQISIIKQTKNERIEEKINSKIFRLNKYQKWHSSKKNSFVADQPALKSQKKSQVKCENEEDLRNTNKLIGLSSQQQTKENNKEEHQNCFNWVDSRKDDNESDELKILQLSLEQFHISLSSKTQAQSSNLVCIKIKQVGEI